MALSLLSLCMASLHNVWKILYTAKDTLQNGQFDSAFREICEIATAAEFAYVWPRILRVSQLQPETSLYFVRDLQGELPAWERYPNGGCYHFKKSFKRDGSIEVVDRIWEKLVFAVLSEQLEEPIISAIQAITRHDNAEFVVWHHESITKRIYSRVQLKLGPIFETRVLDIVYQTNMDAILYKNKLQKEDEQSRERKETEKTQYREPHNDREEREDRGDAEEQNRNEKPTKRVILVEDLNKRAEPVQHEIVFEIIEPKQHQKGPVKDTKKLEFREEAE